MTPPHWIAVITVKAETFPALVKMTAEATKEIVAAKSVHDIHTSAVGHGTEDGPPLSFTISITSPIELRVAELRREADELEKEAVDGRERVRRV